MKVVAFLVVFLFSEVLSLGYHADVGIPEAARLQRQGAVSSRIIGGMPSEYGDNPYLVGLVITLTTGQVSVCGGTVLKADKVLTAAQCWYDGYRQGKSLQVVAGTLNIFRGWRRDVSKIAIHPGFHPLAPANDLAMLTIRRGYQISFNDYLKPVLLPSYEEVNETFVGVPAVVSGFGKTSDWASIGPNSAQQSVTVPVIPFYECYQALGYSVNSRVICTSGLSSWGACGGDTGGPLVIRNYKNGSDLLIGVVSIQSPLGCQNGFPTGYMRVTSYLSWILSN